MKSRLSPLFAAGLCVALVESYVLWLAILAPEGMARWAVAGLSLPVMWLIAEGYSRIAGRDPDSVRLAVAGAALIVALPLAVIGAGAVGLIEEGAQIAARLNGVAVGLVLAGMANVVPRRWACLPIDSAAAARRQRLVRFAGRTLVVAGLAHALLWLVAPIANASYWSMAPVAGGLILIALRTVRLRTSQR